MLRETIFRALSICQSITPWRALEELESMTRSIAGKIKKPNMKYPDTFRIGGIQGLSS